MNGEPMFDILRVRTVRIKGFYRVSLLLPFEAQVKRRTTFPGMLRRRSQTRWRLPAVCNLPPPLWESCEPSGEKVKAANHQIGV